MPLNRVISELEGHANPTDLLTLADGQAVFDPLGAAAAATPSIATRSAMAAIASPANGAMRYLTESGREGEFVFSTANLSTLVTADTQQGVYVPPAADTTGASGAWVRKFKGIRPNVDWFGAVADDTLGAGTNNGSIFAAAYATSLALAASPDIFENYSPGLDFSGYYYLGTTQLNISSFCPLVGGGSGMVHGAQTQLRWAANTSGIWLHYDDNQTYDAQGSPIRGTALVGGWNGSNEGEYHAIKTSVRFPCDDVIIHDWQGDGINGLTDSTITPKTAPNYGNSNGTSLRRLRIYNVRDAVNVQFGDANVWLGAQMDMSYCRRNGINDGSFLGCAWDACQAAVVGIPPGTYTPCAVSSSGIWFAVIYGQETWCSTNSPPATYVSNQGWAPFDTGAPNTTTFNVPAWTNGTTYRCGSPYHSTNANAASHFRDCYTEGGCTPLQLGPLTLYSGSSGAPIIGARFYANNGKLATNGYITVESKTNGANTVHEIGSGDDVNNELRRIVSPLITPWVWYERFDANGSIALSNQNSFTAGDNPYLISHPTSTQPWGPGRVNFQFGYGLGGLKVRSGTAAPTSGAWLIGDRLWNSAPAVGSPKSWVCTVSGSPGTWVSEGNL